MFHSQISIDIPLSSLFMITGRVLGDDDDTAYIVEATDPGSANTLFISRLQNEAGGDSHTEVFIVSSISLERAIIDRVRSSTGGEL